MRKINILEMIMSYKVKTLRREISELIDRKNGNIFLVKKKENQIIEFKKHNDAIDSLISDINKTIMNYNVLLEVKQ